MTAIVTCIACQHGQHDLHQEVVEALSPEQIAAGLCGGKVCRCEGECQDESLSPALTYGTKSEEFFR